MKGRGSRDRLNRNDHIIAANIYLRQLDNKKRKVKKMSNKAAIPR
jgi:hypothetical protein